jgi:hypothetical protein
MYRLNMIDIHTHIGAGIELEGEFKGILEVKAEHLIGYMDQVGVEKSVLLSLFQWEGKIRPRYEGLTPLTNEAVLEASLKYPHRIVPFFTVDPGPTAEEEIKGLKVKGFKGFGEHKVDMAFDDPRCMEIFQACGEIGLPVLTHNDPLLRFPNDVEAIKNALNLCSDTIFIFHGESWWRHISGEVDYSSPRHPQGTVTPGGRVGEILREHSNAFADVSACSGYSALNRDKAFTKRFLEENADKVIFGTDFPCFECYEHGGQFGPNKLHLGLLQSYNLDKDVYRKIIHDNAVKLFNLQT